MALPTPPPDNDTLRQFLLGALPPERAEQVLAWLGTDPTRAAPLDSIAAHDSVTDAMSDHTEDESVPSDSVARVIDGVSIAVRAARVEVRDTSDHGETTPQVRVPGVALAIPWPPTQLGGFRVVRELGHGGMGYVFEAEDQRLGRRVAVKVLTPELARQPDAVARFLREARSAANVEHENVVPILHVDEQAGAPFIVMPLLRGESLSARISRAGALPVGEIVRIGRDVVAGLAAAHARGLVHRDLKPANVWLDEGTGRARVLDFGLARLSDGADALTDSQALMGTPPYMAPEQLDGKPATPRSDLFSLGATLYECATGQKAFTGPSITAIIKAVAEHHPPSPTELNPEVPTKLSELILRLLSKNAARRPTDAREVVAALMLDPEPDRSANLSTVTWVDSEPRWKKRRRLWLVGGGIVAAVIGVSVWLATRASTPVVVENPPVQPEPALGPDTPPALVKYRGKVDVKIRREVAPNNWQMSRLNEASALPMKRLDEFRIECAIDPPSYVYLVWVDPEHDVTPVYPWDPAAAKRKLDPWATRPAKEVTVSSLTLPNGIERYRAPNARPGVATMVLLARPTPLDVPDGEVKKWFEALPELPLPSGREDGVMWFDDYTPSKDPDRRGNLEVVGGDDPFAKWQLQLQKSLGSKVAFATAVSFARTGNNK